ncbi:hypothetical protein D7X55_37745 [Corallococcus sp. AB049A]|uniref:Uncharacterized protein n=1 Tax=Corallococcus interemptor TaxID=2316720 RepID=A0A3A8QVK4_9BACT|nr:MULTISPECIES: hypothetical protein [Corallococcus]RKH40676.1 hypothetical protein D7Y23_34400 [Corallococcus sp. AB050B]RKH71831.1 hypothetical protein D7X96_06785 [Corallococcus interemptor]RKI45176.1 hypothetical protein D7X55_37745 [Corallococcus sp. AB049A]
MTSGRFAPIAAAATAVVSGAFLMLGPAGCDEGAPVDCGDTCPPVEGTYPLAFPGDAGLPSECVNLNVVAPANGDPLVIQHTDGGIITGTLTGVALTGQLYASGALILSGSPIPSSDGGVSSFLSLTATFAGGPADGGGVGSLSGTFTGNYSRIQGTSALRCNVARPFTATRQ